MLFYSCLLVLITSSLNLAQFDFEVFPFDLDSANEQETHFSHESSGEVVSIEEKSDVLNGGIEKTSKIQETRRLNAKNGTVTTERKVTEFYRYPNGTIRKVEYSDDDFSGDTKIDCIEDADCNKTHFCDRLTFSCKPRLGAGAKCENNLHCKSGLRCRNHQCMHALGKSGESCASDSDCQPDHCCISQMEENVCSRRPTENESCDEEDLFISPRFFGFSRDLTTPEKPRVCPCQAGLQCKRVRTFFFFETKRCQNPLKSKKAKKMQQKKKQKAVSKRSVLDDLIERITGLMKNI